MTQFQARCRTSTCSAPITWAVVAKSGKGVPLDSEQNPDGKCYVVGETEDGRQLVAYATSERPAPDGAVMYSSHFETCPAAGDWSRGDSKQSSKTRR